VLSGKAVRARARQRDNATTNQLNAAVQSEYAQAAGMSPAALTAAMAPYLPIVRARAFLGPAGTPALRERLIQSVEAALRSGD
jgi:hypothetical protein